MLMFVKCRLAHWHLTKCLCTGIDINLQSFLFLFDKLVQLLLGIAMTTCQMSIHQIAIIENNF